MRGRYYGCISDGVGLIYLTSAGIYGTIMHAPVLKEWAWLIQTNRVSILDNRRVE